MVSNPVFQRNIYLQNARDKGRSSWVYHGALFWPLKKQSPCCHLVSAWKRHQKQHLLVQIDLFIKLARKIPSWTILNTIQNTFKNPSVTCVFIKITYNIILEISVEIQEFVTRQEFRHEVFCPQGWGIHPLFTPHYRTSKNHLIKVIRTFLLKEREIDKQIKPHIHFHYKEAFLLFLDT